MSKTPEKTSSVKRLKISGETRRAYERRDKSLDNADPDAPVLPPRILGDGAIIGKYYGPLKIGVSMRLDNDVLA